jgi:hypothetical protein
VAESPDKTDFQVVGTDEGAAVNWKEIPPYEYYQELYKASPRIFHAFGGQTNEW